LSWQVGVPAALPALATGLTQGWALAWPSLLTAEFLSRSLGLGGLLQVGGGADAAASALSVMVLIVAVGAAIHRWVFTPLERRLGQRWGHETDRWRAVESQPAPIDRAVSGY
jgi:ABC-type nitrate/sulfonate/bicarbonate transport system permease component